MPLGRTTDTPRRDAKTFLAKAEEFLRAAERAASAGDHDAALLAAIHSAMTANDAACATLLGRRSSDPDHQRAADLLESAGDRTPEVAQRARQLRSLLKKKNLVEYEARRATVAESHDALERAQRFVAWSREVAERGGL